MNKCGIVKDLLPLYADDVCSIESKKLVTEHLAECDECCKELESYQLDVITGNAMEKDAVKKFRKKTERRVAVKVISLILAVCIGVFGVVNIYWYFGFRKPTEDLNGLANDYMFAANDNTPTIDIILGENNPYGIDTEKYEDLKFNGQIATYLQNNAYFEAAIRDKKPYKKEVVYNGAESLQQVSMRIRLSKNDKGEYRYLVDFEPLIDDELDDIYFCIDEDMNLILQNPDKNAKETYKSWIYMGEAEAIEYVKQKTEAHNKIRQEIYEEVYEDLRVMMIVLHEGFGIGNVKS